MTVTEATEIHLQQSDIENWYAHPRRKLIRSKGVHLSGVLRVMAQEFGLMKEIPQEDFEEKLPLRMALGQSWEYFAAGLYPEMEYQPGELKRSGIVGSPDGYSATYDAIDEFKRTRKSCRDFDLNANKNKLWIWQVMGYCVMHPFKPRKARLHSLFVEGDYVRGAFGYEERYFRYTVEFERSELDRFWNLVVKFKDKATPEVL